MGRLRHMSGKKSNEKRYKRDRQLKKRSRANALWRWLVYNYHPLSHLKKYYIIHYILYQSFALLWGNFSPQFFVELLLFRPAEHEHELLFYGPATAFLLGSSQDFDKATPKPFEMLLDFTELLVSHCVHLATVL